MKARPFFLVRQRDLQLCSVRAARALRTWEAGWTHSTALEVACTEVPKGWLGMQAWQQHAWPDGASVWVNVPAGFERALERHVFGLADATPGRHLESAMAGAVAAQCLRELIGCLADGVAEKTGASAATFDSEALQMQLRHGAGAVLLSLTLEAKTLRLLVPAALFHSAPTAAAAGPAKTGVLAALDATPVSLTVEVGHADLTLGHLRTLAVGDVIALSSRIDQALPVRGPDGDHIVCHAHLGTRGESRAIELKIG